MGHEPLWSLSKLLITVVAAMGLISAVVYWFAILPSTPSPNDTKQRVEWAIRLMSGLKVPLKKRQFMQGYSYNETQAKVRRYRNARNGKLPELEGLKTQIRELEQNLAKDIPNYLDIIGKLSRVEKTVFNKELDKYNEQLAQKELFHRIKITEIVTRHYQEASIKAPMNITIEKWGNFAPNSNNPNEYGTQIVMF